MKFPDDGKYELINQSDSTLLEGYVSIVVVHTEPQEIVYKNHLFLAPLF